MQVEEDLKMEGVTPGGELEEHMFQVEEDLKMDGVTPTWFPSRGE